MPRYYFDVRRGRMTILDHEGVELTDLKEATREAVRRAVQIEDREALKGAPWSNGAIIVHDEIRNVLEVPLEGTLRALRNRTKPAPLP